MKLENCHWAIVGLDNETGIEDYIDFFDNEDDARKEAEELNFNETNRHIVYEVWNNPYYEEQW